MRTLCTWEQVSYNNDHVSNLAKLLRTLKVKPEEVKIGDIIAKPTAAMVAKIDRSPSFYHFYDCDDNGISTPSLNDEVVIIDRSCLNYEPGNVILETSG